MELEPLIAAKAREKQREEGKTLKQKSAEVIETREELAKFAGVSHDTIHKVEVIEKEAPEEVKESSEIPITRDPI